VTSRCEPTEPVADGRCRSDPALDLSNATERGEQQVDRWLNQMGSDGGQIISTVTVLAAD
jgi:hypothetical protein